MIIAVGNHMAEVTQWSPSEEEWLEDYLSVNEPLFKKHYRTGRMIPNGTTTHTFVKRDKFPAGFIRLVVHGAKKEGFTVKIEDVRTPASVQPVDINFTVVEDYAEEKLLKNSPNPPALWLRYYQRDALETILKRRRGVIWHPTGAGKTELAVAMTMRLPLQWLFIVQDKVLLHNAARRYEQRAGKKAKIIGDGKVDLTGEGNFTVAMAQTLDRRRGDHELWEVVRKAEGIIVDECHQTPAKSIFQITMVSENAAYRIGLSGTPFDRGDQKGMATIGALGPVIHRVKTDELIAAGFLSMPRIEMHICRQESNAPTFQGAYSELVVKSTKRAKLGLELMKRAMKPNLTFVKQVNHGEALVKRAEKAGLRVSFIWGDKKTAERDRAVQDLVRGDIDCIICNVVFQQGVDIPELRSIVRLSAGKSVISTLQVIGRGMRVTDDKNTFEVYDIYDEDCAEYVVQDQGWMKKHAKKRRKSYEREGHTVHIVDPDQLPIL